MTNDSILHTTIADFLLRPSPPCLLLVAVDMVCLVKTVEALAVHYDWSRINVSAALSAYLVNVSPERRGRRAARWLVQYARDHVPGPLLLYGVPLLFESSLSLDPLTLFLRVGQHAPVIVAWPGRYERGTLTYATPAHAHYRIWSRPSVVVASLNV